MTKMKEQVDKLTKLLEEKETDTERNFVPAVFIDAGTLSLSSTD